MIEVHLLSAHNADKVFMYNDVTAADFRAWDAAIRDFNKN